MWRKLPITILRRTGQRTGYRVASRFHSDRGFDPCGARDFEPGDTLRSLSRKHYARTGDGIVIERHPGRNAFILILIDLSASELIGAGPSKLEASLACARNFGIACLARGHIVQVMCFTTIVETEFPPVRDMESFEGQIDSLETFEATFKGTDHREVMERALSIAGRDESPADMVCFVSDLLFPQPGSGFLADIEELGQAADLIALVVRDRAEIRMPVMNGVLPVRDAEGGAVFLARGVRAGDPLEKLTGRGLDGCVLMTSQSEVEWFDALSDFFLSRRL